MRRGGREGGRGREGGEGRDEEERKGGREGGREGEEEMRKREREGGREGGRERGREGQLGHDYSNKVKGVSGLAFIWKSRESGTWAESCLFELLLAMTDGG